MKLLLDNLIDVDGTALIHTLYDVVDDLVTFKHIRRRPFEHGPPATRAYYGYMDASIQIGYSIITDIQHPWTYFTRMGDGPVVEKVEIKWPIAYWQHKSNLLEML